jgi:chromosomal replication initiator protein
MTVEQLLLDRRTQPLVRRRQIAMFVARRLTARSLCFIAGKFGGLDHTTVLHAIRTVQDRIAGGDAETIEAVTAIVEKLTGEAR